jgi:pSer/pThr/pTyr-binding forkhead associated (FHA) protein
VPRLDFYLNYELQATIKLEARKVVIGRDPSCEICMPDEKVSRVHALIHSRDGGHEIENRGANGTKVNGHWLESVQSLAPGDAIFISRYILIYQSDDVPPAEDAKTVLVDHMSPESTPS